MGNSFSPIAAIIFMYSLESKIIDEFNDSIRWVRYIDDIFFVIISPATNSNELLDKANKLHPNIQFTIEQPKADSISFLDTEIFLINSGFQWQIYFKPSHSGTILPFNSAAPLFMKRGIVIGELRRAVHRSSDCSRTVYSVNMVLKRLVQNYYPLQFLYNILLNFMINFPTNKTITQATVNDFIYIKLPYINDFIVNKNNMLLKKLNLCDQIRLYYIIPLNLSRLFPIKRDKPICTGNCLLCQNYTFKYCLNKFIIYQIKCILCHKVYIGQTKRTFRTRFKEHIQQPVSAVYKHHANHHSDHQILKIMRPEILHANILNNTRRLYLESMYIYKNCINLMEDIECRTIKYC